MKAGCIAKATTKSTQASLGSAFTMSEIVLHTHPNPNQIPSPKVYFLPLHEPPTLTSGPTAPESPSFCLACVPSISRPAQPCPGSPRPPCPDTWRAAGWGCPASFGTRQSLCSAVQRASLPALRALHGSSVGGGWEWVNTCRRQLTCLSSLLLPSSGPQVCQVWGPLGNVAPSALKKWELLSHP